MLRAVANADEPDYVDLVTHADMLCEACDGHLMWGRLGGINDGDTSVIVCGIDICKGA